MKPGDDLNCRSITPVKHETQPPARFTEASLVQTLEREGVGRPSTYATIIGTVQDRGYVVKTGNQLVPTFTALAVNRLLEDHFPSLVDTQFTARMEQSLDEIADGEVESLPYLKAFYLGEHGLETLVAEKTQSIDPRTIYAMALDDLEARVRIGKYGPYIEQQVNGSVLRTTVPVDVAPADLTDSNVEKLLRDKEKGPDTLGWDPVSGRQVFALTGRFGPYVQLGTPEEAAENPDGKPKRASLLKGMTLETITLETALALLALPRALGSDPADPTGEPIEAGVARLGPYVRRGKDYRSLTASDDVLTVGLDRALELFAQPKAVLRGRTVPAALRDLGVHPADGKPIQVMNGRYGPYVKHGDINATLPRGTTPDTVTLSQAIALIAERAAVAPKKKVTRRTGAATTKTTAAKKATAATKTTAAKSTKTASAKTPKATAVKVTATKAAAKTTKTAAKPAVKKPTAVKPRAKKTDRPVAEVAAEIDE
jgi:DNA topoisomerase-1